jgi:hypothetical protein
MLACVESRFGASNYVEIVFEAQWIYQSPMGPHASNGNR